LRSLILVLFVVLRTLLVGVRLILRVGWTLIDYFGLRCCRAFCYAARQIGARYSLVLR
jgi:hypothetical protein